MKRIKIVIKSFKTYFLIQTSQNALIKFKLCVKIIFGKLQNDKIIAKEKREGVWCSELIVIIRNCVQIK